MTKQVKGFVVFHIVVGAIGLLGSSAWLIKGDGGKNAIIALCISIVLISYGATMWGLQDTGKLCPCDDNCKKGSKCCGSADTCCGAGSACVKVSPATLKL